MTQRSTAMTRVISGNGIIRRPGWLERILTAFDVRKTRIDLSKLSDEHLQDVGVTRDQVEAEIKRSMWDAPEYFRAHR